MSKTLKKALAIILTILMIVPTMPVAFADETAVEIEHQPTSGEPFVKLTDDVDATYQWRSLNLGNEITGENAEVWTSGEESASYSAENGWSPVLWDNGMGGNHFVISLDKGQKITLKLDGIAYTLGIWNDTLDIGAYIENARGDLVTFEAPETADYYTYYYGPAPVNIKAYSGEYNYSNLVSEKEATLKNPVFGVTYLCRVTLANGTLTSDSFEYGYAITHQPTVEEPFVELNEDTDATYQWKTVTEDKITIDDTVANPSAYVTKTNYDAATGWNGDFCFNDETSAIFFGVNLKKGQKIYADFGEAVSGEIGIWDYSVNEGAFDENGTEDGKIEFTALWDGYFEFYANNVDSETRVKATTDGYKYENIENATEARYISTEELVFACEITFADGTTEMSETFSGAHEHHYESVVTEYTCTENGYTTHTCSCGDAYTDSITLARHNIEQAEAKAPTCTEPGHEAYEYCSKCELSTRVEIPALGHTEETLAAVEPTCTETGLTEGKKCTVCNEITVEQEEVPAIEHSYTSEITTPATHTSEGVETFTCSVCGDTYTEVIEKTPDHLHEVEVTAPTCTEDGYTTYTCACGDTYTADVVPATGHTEEALEAVEPTCTETGLTAGKKCSVCDEILEEQEVIPVTGHTEETLEAQDPTCTETGLTEGKKCSVCDEILEAQEVVPTIGHTEETLAAVPATCTGTGLTEGKKCSVCDEILEAQAEIPATGHTNKEAVEENRVEPDCITAGHVDKVVYCEVCNAEVSRTTETLETVGHDYEAVVTAPTCTVDGYTTYTCSVCGDTYKDDEVQATDHIPAEAVEEIITPATCVATGSADMVVYCSSCNEKLSSETVTLEALGHTQEVVEENRINPTCTISGSVEQVVRCKVCHEEFSRRTEIILATGHKNKEAVVDEYISEPTCTEYGKAKMVIGCENCDYIVAEFEQNLLPTGHKYDAVVTAPTCIEGGYTTYTCSACGDTYKGDEVPATGHTEEIFEAVEPTCTETGLTVGKKCSVCDEILEEQEVVPATGHTNKEAVEENRVEPTCTTNGSVDKVVYCEVCNTEVSRTPETLETIDHIYDSVVTEPTCTEGGYTTYTCSVCGDTYDGDEVPALGHTPENAVEENKIEPTCTEDGSVEIVVYCAVCDTEISRTPEILEKTGHTPENAVEENKVEPTCTEDGSVDIVVYCATCDAEISRDTEVITKTGHTPAEEVEENYVAPTCTVDGSVDIVVYCATCDAELSRENDVIAKTGHTPSAPVDENYVAPTCTETGSKDVVVYCSVCDAEISRDTVEVETAAHPDEENDGWCDECGVQYCDHACHQTGFAKILYVIVLIFQMFFGVNQYCDCGVAHY